MLRQQGAGLFIMLDLHAHLGDARHAGDPVLLRLLRDVSAAFQSGPNARTLIMVCPVLNIPAELDKDITLLDFPLPGEAEIHMVLENLISTNAADGGRITADLDDEGRERLVKAACGLTLAEATNAFARAMVNNGSLTSDDVQIVVEEKRQAVRKSGLLEFVDVDINLDDVGGLQNLKQWLNKRNSSWLAEAAEYGVPAPKGVLMTGVPGCGKSMTAKATAAAWGLPLLRLDIGKIFSGLIGSSEHNMRAAIRTAEATSPCVLWIDEIEKGFAGTSGISDSGTSSRVFGSFLTWMQEKTSPVFVIATANRVDRLPPEFLRRGRFDEIFFIDLPTKHEREQIWQLHLTRRLKASKTGPLPLTDELLSDLVDISDGYSGAEIEQAVVAAMFDAFAERRSLTADDLNRAVRGMVPLSVTQAERIAEVRNWASARAVAATSIDDGDGSQLMDDFVRVMRSRPLPPEDRGGIDFR